MLFCFVVLLCFGWVLLGWVGFGFGLFSFGSVCFLALFWFRLSDFVCVGLRLVWFVLLCLGLALVCFAFALDCFVLTWLGLLIN